MMESLRSATRNTAFERWLASTMGSGSSSLLSHSEGHQTVQAPARDHDDQPEPSPDQTGLAATAGVVAHDLLQKPAHSEDSYMPEAQLTVLQSRDGGRADSFGSSRMLSDTTASMHAIAPYLAPSRARERTAESQPGPSKLPEVAAEAAVPGTHQPRIGSTDTGPFRPGWKVHGCPQTSSIP